MKYKIIKQVDTFSLEEDVNERIKKWYVPLWWMCFDNKNYMYCQVMIKKDEFWLLWVEKIKFWDKRANDVFWKINRFERKLDKMNSKKRKKIKEILRWVKETKKNELALF